MTSRSDTGKKETLKLEEIAEISTGLSYHSKDITEDTKCIHLIQVKDIQNNELKTDSIYRIKMQYISDRFRIVDGDILFASKGNRNFAYHYKGELGKVTASSTFFILRIKRNTVIPEYLTWYLNSKPAIEFYKDSIHGTFIPSISKAKLSKFPVPVPALEIQKTIIKLDSCLNQERSLTEQILKKRTAIVNEIINRKIKHE